MTVAMSAAIVLAGGLAAVVRHLVWTLIPTSSPFPWALLVVNTVGSALGGVALGLGTSLDPDLRLLLLAGVAGGLTTFSTLSVDTVLLILDQRMRVAALSVSLNLALGVGAVSGGYLLTEWLMR